MKVITEAQREKLNELLHDEIVEQIKQGDSTVLFGIIENLNHTTAFYSLSDEKQEEIKFK